MRPIPRYEGPGVCYVCPAGIVVQGFDKLCSGRHLSSDCGVTHGLLLALHSPLPSPILSSREGISMAAGSSRDGQQRLGGASEPQVPGCLR
jgi:hypothetical protein